MRELAPIVLFVYNRPWHVQQTIKALRKNELASCSDLFVFSDGPKGAADKRSIQVVREYLQTISGFKSISIIKKKRNIGLADSVINGVTEIVGRYGRVIVLEDDLLTAVDFLRFMNEALDYYSEENKVMQISGHMFNLVTESKADGFFLPFTNSIGWATWQRAWEFLDPKMSGYGVVKNNSVLRKKFNLGGAYNYFDMLEAQLKGKIDSWAIRWYLSVFLAEGLILYPTHSKIKHIGFDGSGAHCDDSGSRVYANSVHITNTTQINFPLVSLDRDVYSQVMRLFSSQKSLKCKLRNLFVKFKF